MRLRLEKSDAKAGNGATASSIPVRSKRAQLVQGRRLLT
jgi:hypothetical protein